MWTIIAGKGSVVLNDTTKEVNVGDVIYIKKGDWHSLKAVKDLHFIEVQIGDEVSEYDIERK